MKLVILGPPGSGKGTYSRRISTLLKIAHLSTGDIFRDSMARKTELGERVKQYMEAGHLVPDEITNEVVKERLSRPDCKNGFFFDGYPRTLNQAKTLEKIAGIDIAIYLDIPEALLIEKAMGRRICKECGDIYNVADISREGVRLPPMLPKAEGKCDKCGGEIVKRDDDTVEKITERLKVQQVPPEIVRFYEDEEKLLRVKVIGAPEIMVPIIMKAIEEFENHCNECECCH